jgi:hypothetical protein
MTKTELFDTVVAVNSVWNPENPEPWVAVPLSLICKLLADATDTQTVSPQTIQDMERSGFDWHGQKVVLVSEAANRMGAATEGAIETYQKEKVAAKE